MWRLGWWRWWCLRGGFAVSALLLTFYTSLDIFPSYRSPIGALPVATSKPTNLLQGTLDLLILKCLATGEMHGLGISRRVEQMTKGTFVVKAGSLFPALHRMEEEGWISAFWGESENNRRAKYYRLTKAGAKQLESETKRWDRISMAITRALETS
jgi:PadR family transcriptional regulator, regulatory protein PadR